MKEKAMPTKKKSSPHRARTRARTDRTQAAKKRLRETWTATVQAVTAAEEKAERRLRHLLARKAIEPADVRAAVGSFRVRVEKERRKAARQIESRLSGLQERLRRERKDLGRAVAETVRGTLVALNIPSRREVSELTRKVDALSRKIDGYRRPSSTRSRA
jgi:Poly(hydroxyalcanoate) granule associated protein (phasin)